MVKAGWAGFGLFMALAVVGGSTQVACSAHSGEAASGSSPGTIENGAVIDKSGDMELQKMISEVLPKFRQAEFSHGGKVLRYNLYAPAQAADTAKLPLVIFIADASTVGGDVTSPLRQGYGGLVWATQQAQAKNPCYVLVPQFGNVAVDGSWHVSDEVGLIVPLVQELVQQGKIDPARIYATGQAMGGMVAMYLNITKPELFAASLFVDCNWDPARFAELVRQNFLFIVAGESGKAYADIKPLEEAAEKAGRSYTFASWDAQLPLETQNDLVKTMLGKGAPINIFEFEPGTVLPSGGSGNEQMYSFDCAYRLAPLRDWLFQFVKGK